MIGIKNIGGELFPVFVCDVCGAAIPAAKGAPDGFAVFRKPLLEDNMGPVYTVHNGNCRDVIEIGLTAPGQVLPEGVGEAQFTELADFVEGLADHAADMRLAPADPADASDNDN